MLILQYLFILLSVSEPSDKDRVLNLGGLETPEIYRRLEIDFKLKVIDLESPPTNTQDLEDFEFYIGYFESQRSKAYSALLIPKDKPLPGGIDERPYKDRSLLLVNSKTTRESLIHLLFHHLDSSSAENSVSEDKTEAAVQKIESDREIINDHWIVSNREKLKIPAAEYSILIARQEKHLRDLERSAQLVLLELPKSEEAAAKIKSRIQKKIDESKKLVAESKEMTKEKSAPSSQTEKQKKK